MKLIDKDALVAEIKECIKTYNKGYANGDDKRADALEVLLHDIANFEVKEMKEEPVSEEWIEELTTKLDSMSKEDFKKVFDKYAVDFNEEPIMEEAANKYAIESYPDEPSTGQFGTGEYESYVNMSGQRECAVEDFKAGAKWWKEQIEEILLSEVLPCFMHDGEADKVVAKLDEVLNQKK